jgi:hypothetical protein
MLPVLRRGILLEPGNYRGNACLQASHVRSWLERARHSSYQTSAPIKQLPVPVLLAQFERITWLKPLDRPMHLVPGRKSSRKTEIYIG